MIILGYWTNWNGEGGKCGDMIKTEKKAGKNKIKITKQLTDVSEVWKGWILEMLHT